MEKISERLPMVCACGEEGEAGAEELRGWYRALWPKVLLPPKEPIDIEHIVMDISARYGTRVTILADQWFGVGVETEHEKLYVECDRVSDGLLACFKWLYEKYGGSSYGED